MKKNKLKYYGFLAVAMILSAFLRAVCVHSFIIPNSFAPGGVTGIATMLQYLFGINSGYSLIALNIPLLILAFFLIGKKFSIITAIALVLQSGALVLFEQFHFFTYAAGDNAVLAAIAGGIVGGVGVGIMLKIGGSTGGTDIIATLIYKHWKAANVNWFIFILDAVVVGASFFVYGYNLTPVLLSLTEMFASSKANELIIYGFKAAVKFEVITTHPEELSAELMRKLQRGVTSIPAVGMYSHTDKSILICVVRRRQVAQFQKILKTYPETFAFISSTSEVLGYGFNDSSN